jgi:AcrR family transcriptional regulator
VDVAIAVADERGLDALTMRSLAAELGVGPMAPYRHVANKDDLVGAMVDRVFEEIGVPPLGAPWRVAMHERATAVRDTLVRHRWAIGLMDSRPNPGPATLRHHDAVIGCLRAAGFDIGEAAHAYSLLDSYIFGFATTQMSLPFASPTEAAEVAGAMFPPSAAAMYPHLVVMVSEQVLQPGYDYRSEFDYGLGVILDGLDRVREAEPDARA